VVRGRGVGGCSEPQVRSSWSFSIFIRGGGSEHDLKSEEAEREEAGLQWQVVFRQ